MHRFAAICRLVAHLAFCACTKFRWFHVQGVKARACRNRWRKNLQFELLPQRRKGCRISRSAEQSGRLEVFKSKRPSSQSRSIGTTSKCCLSWKMIWYPIMETTERRRKRPKLTNEFNRSGKRFVIIGRYNRRSPSNPQHTRVCSPAYWIRSKNPE